VLRLILPGKKKNKKGGKAERACGSAAQKKKRKSAKVGRARLPKGLLPHQQQSG
jgi:hypothetical protein